MSKGLETLDNLRCMTSLSQDCPYKESNDLCNIIEKELKALEIIKNICSPLLKQYLLDLLPKEEYDLLKEVLS